MECFARDLEKGCKALSYDNKDIENGACQNCKFCKTPQQRMIDKFAKPSNINRLILVMDGLGQGMFRSIHEIDDKLKAYYKEHQEEENANAKENSNFIDDYNLMYENHKIQIIAM